MFDTDVATKCQTPDDTGKGINWIKDWYTKQEQHDKLVDTYKNNEVFKRG